MVSTLLRQSLFALGLGATALCSSACTVYARPAPPVAVVDAPVVEDGYEPQYYDGAVVYYDEGGRPYYYNEGAVVWVNPGYVGYGALVGHWRANRVAYGRWYGHRGYAYRSYRRGRR